MKRWRPKLLGFIFLSSLILLGLTKRDADAFWKLGKDKKNPRVIVVFVDMSGSTNSARRTVYNEAFEKIYQNLNQGDRIVVGTITSRSYIDFKPAVDEEIPKQSIWVNRIQFEQNFAKAKKNIRKEVNRLLSRKKGTPYTEILNSLNIADTIFHNEKRQKILVILSDMVQDSKEYKFDRVKLTNNYINGIIKHRQKQNLVPNLADVKIYVAGASAADSRKFRSIEKFWARYFAATGADYSSHRYGHSLLEFEKEPS
ncbi:MAG: hypothetical protein JSU83_07240 [Deltaproteobacteria bacterium]|nr:MAG: hypothetical protein JSU83_07240 [Deltaproteobacteria bacterium]